MRKLSHRDSPAPPQVTASGWDPKNQVGETSGCIASCWLQRGCTPTFLNLLGSQNAANQRSWGASRAPGQVPRMLRWYRLVGGGCWLAGGCRNAWLPLPQPSSASPGGCFEMRGLEVSLYGAGSCISNGNCTSPLDKQQVAWLVPANRINLHTHRCCWANQNTEPRRTHVI